MEYNVIKMSSSLGVTMSLPSGTLESRRAEELSRRQQKQQQQQQLQQKEQEQQQTAPRRLAPQRKKKPSTSTESTSATVREHLPISIPIDVDDDVVNGELHHDDDKIDDVKNITSNIADWTLSNADEKISNYAKDYDDYGEEEEQRSYHGEIESVEDNDVSNNEHDSVMEEESDDGGYKVISEEDVPLDPPPLSMPMVLVDLEMLCGVVPYDEEEKQEIVIQLMEMLLGSVHEDDDDGNDQEHEENNKPQTLQELTKGDGLSLDFDERVVELFESGAARHVDSMMPAAIACVNEEKKANQATNSAGRESVYPFTLIPYPEFLSSEASPTSRSTIRLWKLLNNTHESPLMNRLFAHLRNTSRSLIWKADMYQELCSLAKQEYKAQILREQMTEYNQWKESVRKERLEKLYDVRDTFQLRVDVARRKHQSFVKERELRVERELKRRGLYQYRITSRKHTEENLNVGEDNFDDDGWGPAVNEVEIFGDEMDDIDEGNSHDDGDEWSPLGLKIAINTPKDSIKAVRKAKEEQRNNSNLKQLETITHSDNQNRKSERRQKLLDETFATNHTFFEQKEAAIREALKTNDERIAEAVLTNLEEKLQNVDELLETLQEEEWADEEEDESSQPCIDNGTQLDDETGEPSEMTLLDQILAMILGALPKERATVDKEHFEFVKNEHASIISSWKETFGRLPPFPSSEPEPSKDTERMRNINNTLGDHFGDFRPAEMSTNLVTDDWTSDRNDKVTLIGNDTSAWDEIDDWDAFFPSNVV